MHEHNECEHELKYCKKCDVVYCEKCGREWNTFRYNITSPFTVTYPNTWIGDGSISVSYHASHN